MKNQNITALILLYLKKKKRKKRSNSTYSQSSNWKSTFPWRKPIPANAKSVKSVAATTLLQSNKIQFTPLCKITNQLNYCDTRETHYFGTKDIVNLT